jgi:peptide/nickel transport system ATP-binding protein
MNVLSVRDLTVTVDSPEGGRTLLSGMTFDVGPGESVALVGESGSGKSLTARAILGLLPSGLHAAGEVAIGGHLVNGDPAATRPLLGGVASLLLQDPFTMLNPLRRVGPQLADSLPGGYRRSDANQRREVERRLGEVGLPVEVSRRYPYQLSGGMRQRIGLAAALARDPQLLIADEPTTALDVTTQREVLRLVRSIQRARGMGFVLITHDLRIAFSLSDRVLVMYAGHLVETGTARAVSQSSSHPYTRALLAAEPPVDRRVAVLASLPGSVPHHDDVIGRCPFADRCPLVANACLNGTPVLRDLTPAHASACLLTETLVVPAAQPAAATTDGETRTSATALLAVHGLSKTFSGDSAAALDSVSIEVRQGESVGIVGESGSGKTTLARCVVGLATPSQGSITLDGTDVTSWNHLDRGRRRELRRVVQLVFQDPYSTLNPVRTVGATLREVLTALGQPADRADVERLLDLVGLPATYRLRRPAALSGGERQRVAIARALAGLPRLLVCDEPVSALDVSVQAQILELLSKLRAELGMSLLFITHDLAVVRQISDFVYVLQRGQCVESGPTSVVLSAPKHPYTQQLLASVPRDDPSWLTE